MSAYRERPPASEDVPPTLPLSPWWRALLDLLVG
jgi:hypothetical protein